jgi:hypothetical protein
MSQEKHRPCKVTMMISRQRNGDVVRICSLILGSLLLVAAAPMPEIDAGSVFSFYKKLSLLTPQPVIVSAVVAAACVAPPSPSLIEEERRHFGPHAEVAVNLYANETARTALAGQDRFPSGAIIVKEKLKGDEASAIGGMIKRQPGYDPVNGDWEYFYAERSGKFTIGRLDNCIACHARAKSTDYVFFRDGR